MNKSQIVTVERLRHEGKGPSAIAKETGISINTINHISAGMAYRHHDVLEPACFVIRKSKRQSVFARTPVEPNGMRATAMKNKIYSISVKHAELYLNLVLRSRSIAQSSAFTMTVTIPSRALPNTKSIWKCCSPYRVKKPPPL